MKPNRYALATILAAATLSVTAQESADTLAVVNNAHSVIVTESKSGNTITVVGQGDDKDFYYSYSQVENPADKAEAQQEESEWGLSLPFLKERAKKKSEVIWLGKTYIGISLPVDEPQGLDASIECGVGELVGVRLSPWAKGPSFSLGLGLHYQQYTLHSEQIFGMDGKRIGIIRKPEGSYDTSSRLRNFGFQVPVTISQKLTGDFGFSIGASLKFNTYTKASSRYSIDGIQYDKSFKGLHQRLMTVDIYAAVGLMEDIGLYVRYSPMSLFQSGYGPKFDAISFGITLGI